MARKATKTKSVKDWIAQATDKVDPITVAAMTLGGTASMLGITPPMTQILMTMSGFGKNPFDLGIDTERARTMLPGFQLTMMQKDVEKMWAEKGSSEIVTNPDFWSWKQIALFSSGAMEALITLELVRNKEFMNTLIGAGTALGSAAIRAAGEAVPL